MPIIELREFLKKNVEGYLLEDLKTLREASPASKLVGAAGYPLVMTTFAGIELLGYLVSKERFSKRAGKQRFQEYWKEHLYPPATSARAEAGAVLYEMARHGIAHLYAVKGLIEVVRGGQDRHLTRTATGGIFIDAVRLSVDFRESYEKRIVPRVGGALAGGMQDRLNEMAKSCTDDCAAMVGEVSQLRLPSAPGPNGGSPMYSSTAPF